MSNKKNLKNMHNTLGSQNAFFKSSASMIH